MTYTLFYGRMYASSRHCWFASPRCSPAESRLFPQRGGFLASQGETRILSIAPPFGSVKVPADHEKIVVDQMTKNDLNVK